ncbi:MAG: T9SS type A sorting domain-containing protein [Bacteroidota bacterium]|nr:MAG: T9SS type A sorting domain-containing protein [Bacteroidota bacterium]
MKTKIYLSLIVGMLLLNSSLFSQQMSIYSSTGFTTPHNLIDGTTAQTTFTGTIVNCEIVVKLTEDNYIKTLRLIVGSGANYTCKVYTSFDNVIYKLAGSAISGTNDFIINANACYIKITATHASGYLILNELYAITQQKSVDYTYDLSGNRIARRVNFSAENGVLYLKSDDEFEEFLVEGEVQVLVYPNPTKGLLILELQNLDVNEYVPVMINIFNNEGKTMISESFKSNRIEMDLSDFSVGLYFIDINFGNKRQLLKVIKE